MKVWVSQWEVQSGRMPGEDDNKLVIAVADLGRWAVSRRAVLSIKPSKSLNCPSTTVSF